MKTSMALKITITSFLLLVLSCTPENILGQSDNIFTKNTVDNWMEKLSNWGRWGTEDQLGTVNLITPQKRIEASSLVKTGISVSLARNTDKHKAIDNPRPFRQRMLGIEHPRGQFVSDNLDVSYHGYAHTHMDSLCHMSYKGKMYNGFEQSAIDEHGAPRLAVTNFKNGIITKGILMDIPRLKGVQHLEPGTPIYPKDLEDWEKKANLRVEPGDVVFIRTGRWSLRETKGPWDASKISAGLHVSSAKWLRERDIAMLGSDAASDVMPSLIEGINQPVHQLMLIAFGTPIFDNCDLEELAEEAARQNRWEFMLTASPVPVTGGTGSPLNPIATF